LRRSQDGIWQVDLTVLAKILDQHDTPLGPHESSGEYPHIARTDTERAAHTACDLQARRGNRQQPPVRKFQKPQVRTGTDKIDAPIAERPVSLRPFRAHPLLSAAGDGHAPDTFLGLRLRVVQEAPGPVLEGFASALTRDPNGGAALRRALPNLPIAGSIRRKV